MTTGWDALPDNIKTFMTALSTPEDGRAAATFTTDAVVTDDGRTYTGRDEIRAWLTASAGEYTYTSQFTGATMTDATVDVGQHLEGNFPGGVVDLHYRFTLDGTSISRLVIEP
ncbi:nuclear transport factor 2 family protein [Nocardia sp. NPDC003979]